MADVFLEQRFDPPVSASGLREQFRLASNCFEMHRIGWQASLLSADGQHCVCQFSCADAESLRIALRQVGANIDAIWSGTVHLAVGVSPSEQAPANVIVTRRFDEPVTLESIQAIEDAGAWCLEVHKVKFVCTFFSRDRKRMICLYCAPDAESVRLAQRQASMPVDQVWSFNSVRPETVRSVSG